jgi:hypothetical protein
VLSAPGPKGTPVEETITFPIPSVLRVERFDELRVIFQRALGRLDKSARVVIERFVLIPR